MSTRTCKCCGWVYPERHVGITCIVCGQPFEERWCPSCRQLKPASSFDKRYNICKKCRRPIENHATRKRLQKLDDMFKEWVDKVQRVPKDYPTLTEDQWLAACSYFDGCARCHSKDIDTRGFFIGAKLGGRYCDWNIIPLCEKCATTWNLEQSIFRNAERRDYDARSTEYRECLAKIVEYLGGKLDDAAGSTE